MTPGEPGWWVPWTAWGSYAALVVAAAAIVMGLVTQKQKRKADAKSEWWRRAQWALEATTSDDGTMYAYGTGMLDILATSDLADKEDKGLLDAVWQGTDTEMDDHDILRLIRLASRQKNLTNEDLAVLNSFVVSLADVDVEPGPGDNESSKEETNG